MRVGAGKAMREWSVSDGLSIFSLLSRETQRAPPLLNSLSSPGLSGRHLLLLL